MGRKIQPCLKDGLLKLQLRFAQLDNQAVIKPMEEPIGNRIPGNNTRIPLQHLGDLNRATHLRFSSFVILAQGGQVTRTQSHSATPLGVVGGISERAYREEFTSVSHSVQKQFWTDIFVRFIPSCTESYIRSDDRNVRLSFECAQSGSKPFSYSMILPSVSMLWIAPKSSPRRPAPTFAMSPMTIQVIWFGLTTRSAAALMSSSFRASSLPA